MHPLPYVKGFEEQKALEGITIAACAKSYVLIRRIGSIEVGKDADLVLWSHHPFHYLAKPMDDVAAMILNGKILNLQKN